MKNEREVIDRTQCKLPEDHYMYKIIGTYGKEFSAFVSAKNEKGAKKVFKRVYDYLRPKILSIERISANREAIYDKRKVLKLGSMNVIENRYTI